MKKSWTRPVIDVGICIGILVLPWWLSGIALVAAIIYFPLYLEALFFAFLFDTLYASLGSFPYVGLIIAALVVLIVMFLKTRIRR